MSHLSGKKQGMGCLNEGVVKLKWELSQEIEQNSKRGAEISSSKGQKGNALIILTQKQENWKIIFEEEALKSRNQEGNPHCKHFIMKKENTNKDKTGCQCKHNKNRSHFLICFVQGLYQWQKSRYRSLGT